MRQLFLIMTFLLFNVTFFALEDNKKDEVFFVSNFHIYPQVRKILISWDYPQEELFNAQLLRSEEPLKQYDEKKVIATFNNNEKTYIDEIEEGSFYYAVLIKPHNVENYNHIIIPYRNTISTPTSPNEEKDFSVASIQTESQEAIIIRWTTKIEDSDDKYLFVYRATQIIENEDLLQKAILIGRVNAREGVFYDKAIPGLDYYYALRKDNTFEDMFVENENYTTTPAQALFLSSVHIYHELADFIPLPLLSFNHDPISGKAFEDPQILRYPFLKNVSSTIIDITNGVKKKFPLIVEDINKNFSDEDIQKLLKLLPDEKAFSTTVFKEEYEQVTTNIENKTMTGNISILEKILCADISEELRARASYYLAISYLLEGDYQNSYLFGLFAHDNFYEETKQLFKILISIIIKTIH